MQTQLAFDEELAGITATQVAIERHGSSLEPVAPGEDQPPILQALTRRRDSRLASISSEILYIGKLDRSRRPDTEISLMLDRIAENYHQRAGKFFKKIWMALLSGFTLLAPVLIMRLHPGLLTSLVTTSVFILAVGVMLATAMKEAEPKDVVGATAAYAAVLVVFIGTGDDSTESDTLVRKTTVVGVVLGSIGGLLLIMMAIYAIWTLLAVHVVAVPIPVPGARDEDFEKLIKKALRMNSTKVRFWDNKYIKEMLGLSAQKSSLIAM